jgi:hypothetical protein
LHFCQSVQQLANPQEAKDWQCNLQCHTKSYGIPMGRLVLRGRSNLNWV